MKKIIKLRLSENHEYIMEVEHQEEEIPTGYTVLPIKKGDVVINKILVPQN